MFNGNDYSNKASIAPKSYYFFSREGGGTNIVVDLSSAQSCGSNPINVQHYGTVCSPRSNTARCLEVECKFSVPSDYKTKVQKSVELELF